MRDRVLKPQRRGAGRGLALPVWRHVALVLALLGIGWSVPAASLGFRIAGMPAIALANFLSLTSLVSLGEQESESSGEETDSEAIGVVPACSRLVREVQPDDNLGASHWAKLSRRGRNSSDGQGGGFFRQGGAALQLPLRC